MVLPTFFPIGGRMEKLKLKEKIPQFLICAEEEDYLPALIWEEELQKRGYKYQLALKGTINYDGKELAILSYLQLYNRDRRAPYLQELKKLINITIFQKIKKSDTILFVIPNRWISPFLLVQILYTILLNIPLFFTNKINVDDPFFNIVDSLLPSPIMPMTYDNFPPLIPMGEDYEM